MIMNHVLRMSNIYAPTLKEVPTDAAIPSHQLLLRAGFMRKSATGLYTYLPLGWRVIKKIEAIIRDEMDGIGAQEMMMPILQDAQIWHESGRWNDYGPELMRMEDRHGNGLCLGPTHEELVTSLVRNELRSYKQLPTTLYQIQSKFRDEIRPRFGLMRSREFIMKDAYSFHATKESLDETYREMGEAYERYCKRLNAAPKAEKTVLPPEPIFKEVELSLTEVLGRRVKVTTDGTKGKLEIEYFSKDDLMRLASVFNEKI